MARSHGLGLLCAALLVAAASATQFRVGGQRCWSVPDTNAEPYNAWAGRMRFQIGDQLLFVYPKETDSVLLVEPAAYNACNTSSYVRKFDDGNTVFTFDRSGPLFFISGNEDNCRANEKLIVVVLADRSGSGTRTPPPSSEPMPSPSTTPAAAPIPTPPSAAPMPAPVATPSSAPSPAGSAPTIPVSSPTSPSTPGGEPQTAPSGSANAPGAEGGSTTTLTPPTGNEPGSASTVVAGFVATLGAYIGYAMLAV